MRPQLKVIDDTLLPAILTEAKRILSEIGVEVRGPKLRQRLLDNEPSLKFDAAGERLLFPPEVVERAIASAPHEFTLYNRAGEAHATLGAIGCILCRGPAG